jgi:hypothetical protein
MAADDDEQLPIDAEAEDEAIGPDLFGQPLLEHPPTEHLYCTSCHQNALLIHDNICPACNCMDAAIGMNTPIAHRCRTSKVVNGQYILYTVLHDATADDAARRILARMELDPGEARLTQGLPARVQHRLVGLADDERLIYSCMRPSAPAGGDVRPASPEVSALPSAPAGGAACNLPHQKSRLFLRRQLGKSTWPNRLSTNFPILAALLLGK